MSTLSTEEIIKLLATLGESELEKVRQALGVTDFETTSQAPGLTDDLKQREAAFREQLQREGLLAPRQPGQAEASHQRWVPLPIRGEPLSDTILRERS